MKIFIDADYKCHVVGDGTMQAIETDFFDGKCDAYIEGFRFVPEGRTWVREDGKVFCGGNMITPWKPSEELDAVQREYERARLTDSRKALAILLGGETT